MLHSIDITDYDTLVYPLLASEAGDWLRADGDEDTESLNALIKTALSQCEVWANQDFVAKTYRMELDETATAGCYGVDRYPFDAITHVKAWIGGVDTTLVANTDYYAKQMKWGSEIVIKKTDMVLDERPDALRITYTTVPNKAAMPLVIGAMKLIVEKLYDKRAGEKAQYADTAERMMVGIRMRGV